MPLTNAQKQRRFRDRNVIVLTDRAEDIAEKLMDMEDQKKLRKIDWQSPQEPQSERHRTGRGFSWDRSCLNSSSRRCR
jgi:hypothetical protein